MMMELSESQVEGESVDKICAEFNAHFSFNGRTMQEGAMEQGVASCRTRYDGDAYHTSGAHWGVGVGVCQCLTRYDWALMLNQSAI